MSWMHNLISVLAETLCTVLISFYTDSRVCIFQNPSQPYTLYNFTGGPIEHENFLMGIIFKISINGFFLLSFKVWGGKNITKK